MAALHPSSMATVHSAALILTCVDAGALLAAGAYGFAKKKLKYTFGGSALAAAALLGLFWVGPHCCAAFALLVATALYWKYRELRAYDNNHTVSLAAKLKIPLMNEDDEDLHRISKKILWWLMLLGMSVSAVCIWEIESGRQQR
mmetsp:Transcript_15394/g.24564  ORF Transcript_15394/g.24564 Transcript_15394/m.24564 type:complete len:144 (+) Transcript_15394:52-483(+)